MKAKLYELIKKYKLTIIIAISIILIGLITTILFININKTSIKEFENNTFSIKYDNSWKIKSKKENLITLKHSKGSTLDIELISLKENYKYLSISEIIDDLLYNIEKQNTSFKLISKKEDTITRNKYNGYKILYENNDSQVMVVIYKKSDKLVTFTYQSTNKYFDILLDSVNNIVYNFDINENQFNLTYKLNLKTSNIKYNKDSEITSLLDKTTMYEIASNNYHVKYLIPDNFKKNSIDSTSGYYELEGLKEGSVSISVNIYNKNIYEHLDKNKPLNLYAEHKFAKEENYYYNYEESIEKMSNEKESYIYKNSYNYDKESNEKNNIIENVIMLYTLDRNHILIIKMSSLKHYIPKELIDMIKIESKENYSSYINSIEEEGYKVFNLNRIIDNIKLKQEEVTIKIPDKYQEVDKNNNIFEFRNFKLNYNEKLNMSDYEIKYSLKSKNSKINTTLETINMTFNKSLNNYKYLTYDGEITLNNKLFKIYSGGYSDLAGVMFTDINRIEYYTNVRVLFYELSTEGYLVIEIRGNDIEISNEILNELTNFEIKTK